MAAPKRQKRSLEEPKTETDFQINDELMHGSVPMLSTAQEDAFSSTLEPMSISNIFKGQPPLPFIFRKMWQILKGLEPLTLHFPENGEPNLDETEFT